MRSCARRAGSRASGRHVIGDWLASPKVAQNAGDPVGLGLGTFATSAIFLGAILATVVYLTVSRSDVIETYEATHEPPKPLDPVRERLGLAGFVLVAAAAAGIMIWAHNQPHATCDPTAASETLPACPKAALTASQASSAAAKYDALAKQAIAEDAVGNTAGSHATVQQMRDRWDADSTALDTPARDKAWHAIDNQMDKVLESYGIDHKNAPFPAAEQEQRVTTLLKVLATNKL